MFSLETWYTKLLTITLTHIFTNTNTNTTPQTTTPHRRMHYRPTSTSPDDDAPTDWIKQVVLGLLCIALMSQYQEPIKNDTKTTGIWFIVEAYYVYRLIRQLVRPFINFWTSRRGFCGLISDLIWCSLLAYLTYSEYMLVYSVVVSYLPGLVLSS